MDKLFMLSVAFFLLLVVGGGGGGFLAGGTESIGSGPGAAAGVATMGVLLAFFLLVAGRRKW